MTTQAHQQRPRNYRAQRLNRRHPHHNPFRLCQLRWNAWPGASPFSMTLTQPTIYRPSSQEGSHEAPSGSSSHYQSPSPYGIQTHLP
ncbi:hypothetical protein Gotur_028700 [Gossypium turneri]